jgi:hypothetical protein
MSIMNSDVFFTQNGEAAAVVIETSSSELNDQTSEFLGDISEEAIVCKNYLKSIIIDELRKHIDNYYD